jgi:MYXO-CTERM domain-containing protein
VNTTQTRLPAPRFALALIFACGLAAPALANLVDSSVPGDRTASAPNGTSTLTPWRASYRIAGNCDWLFGALRAQGYDDSPTVPVAQRWTFNRIALEGSLNLDTYRAYVNNAPVVSVNGANVYQPTPCNGLGGAAFGLSYTAAGNDPTANLHWIQVIHTNSPLGGGGVGPFTNYLDNAANTGTSPYYDFTGTWQGGTSPTGPNWLADRPRREFADGLDWEAQVFLATGNLATRTLNIYDGVWWGYGLTTNAPTPGTLALLGMGGLIAARRRRTN